MILMPICLKMNCEKRRVVSLLNKTSADFWRAFCIEFLKLLRENVELNYSTKTPHHCEVLVS